MHFFRYRGSELYAEETPVKKLAEYYGTPLYIYSYTTLLRHFMAYERAFDGYAHITCFAVKANPNTTIIRLFSRHGGGADVVSGGELHIALKAGVPSRMGQPAPSRTARQVLAWTVPANHRSSDDQAMSRRGALARNGWGFLSSPMSQSVPTNASYGSSAG